MRIYYNRATAPVPPTPGTQKEGVPTCGNEACLAQPWALMTPQQILVTECDTCAADRTSRRLVAADTTDPRYSEAFQTAVAIFSTNDVKYHVNKLRARQWAQQNHEKIHFAIARDMASAAVLQEKIICRKKNLFGCNATIKNATDFMECCRWRSVCQCVQRSTLTDNGEF